MNETTEKKNSLTKQSALILFAKIAGFALSFLLPLLTVRYLTQEKVGVYRQVFLVVMNAVAILPLGFSMSAYYYLNREPQHRPAAILNILLFNFCAGGAAFLTLFFCPQLLGNLFQNAELTALAPLVGVVVWLWIFSTFLETVALANQETGAAMLFIIAAQFTKTALMAGAVILFSTVEAFLYAAILQGVLQTIVLIFYLASRFPKFWRAFDPKFFRRQLIYALPFGLAGLLFTVQTDVHNYFVSYRFGAAAFAVYAYGCFELPLVGMLYESIGAVMIPRMSSLQAAGKKREMLVTTVSAMEKLALVYFPLFVFLTVAADEFITTLFTKSYAASAPIFRLYLLLLPFYCLIIDPIGRAFAEVGGFLLKLRAALFLALVAALYFGIQYLDLRGIVLIVIAFVLVEKFVSTAKILKILDVRRADFHLLKTVGKAASAAALAGAIFLPAYLFAKDFLLQFCLNSSRSVLTLINFEKGADFVGGSLFLAVCFAFFAIVYLFFANLLNVVESRDRENLLGFWRKISARRSAASVKLENARPFADTTNL